MQYICLKWIFEKSVKSSTFQEATWSGCRFQFLVRSLASLRVSSGLDCSLYWRGFALLFLAWQRGARCGNGVGEGSVGWFRSQSRGGPRKRLIGCPSAPVAGLALCTCVLCPVYLWVQCAAWDDSMAAASAEKGCSPGRLGAFTFIRSRGSLRKQLKRQHR